MQFLSRVCLVSSDKLRSMGTKIPKYKKYLPDIQKGTTTQHAYQQTVDNAFSGMVRDEVFLHVVAGMYSLDS